VKENKMMTIIGMIPYIIVGAILATMGYGFMDMKWQFFAILGCMGFSEIIGRIKTLG
jgi:hypothetical protein